MRNIDVFKIFLIQFCVFIIIIHVTCIEGGRTVVYAQSAKEHKSAGAGAGAVAGAASKQISKPTESMENIFSRLDQLKAFRFRIKDCVEHKKDTSWNCFKMSTLRAFDELSTAAVIPIWNGVRFVRSNDTASQDFEIISDMSYQRQDLQHITWFDSLAMRLAKVLHTHVLQLNFKEMTDAYIKEIEQREAKSDPNGNDSIGTARGRRHRYNMLITMMFGVTALGAVLIPMGFQLLSIVSGKALLMAKMALLLASINGLKRVANSGVHYGLYQVPGEHFSPYYDRGDLHNSRNVPGMLPVTQPIAFGVRK